MERGREQGEMESATERRVEFIVKSTARRSERDPRRSFAAATDSKMGGQRASTEGRSRSAMDHTNGSS